MDATLWCNRAYMRTKLEEHGYALADASESCLTLLCSDDQLFVAKAIEIDPKYAKAYFRFVSSF